MAISLLDLLGFGSDRSIANAGQEMLRLRTEKRLIDDLVDALARHDAARSPSGPRPRQSGVGPGDLTTTTTGEDPSRTRRGGTTTHASTDQSRPWRLDYTISDQPGALTAAVQALGEFGVTVGICDVRPGAAGDAVVSRTVVLPPWLDVPAVEYALRCAGATDVRAVPVRCVTGDRPADVTAVPATHRRAT